jgi:hypothetical protein
MQYPRFHAEFFVRQNVREIETYGQVFRDRIVKAFETLAEEANKLRDDEFERLGEMFGPDGDASWAAEHATNKAVEFYSSTNDIRQGVINLMIAGLYHLFEQQAEYIMKELPSPKTIPKDGRAVFKMLHALQDQGIQMKDLPCWRNLEELRLVANVVKHGPGDSEKELRQKAPSLFRECLSMGLNLALVPVVKPLVGEGLALGPEHFEKYAETVKVFWEQLIEKLLPVFCPH